MHVKNKIFEIQQILLSFYIFGERAGEFYSPAYIQFFRKT